MLDQPSDALRMITQVCQVHVDTVEAVAGLAAEAPEQLPDLGGLACAERQLEPLAVQAEGSGRFTAAGFRAAYAGHGR